MKISAIVYQILKPVSRIRCQSLNQLQITQYRNIGKFSKLVRPPVRVYGVHGRYAEALYSAASKQNKLKDVENDLNKIKNILQGDKKLRELVLDPSVSRQIKEEDMKAIIKALKLSDTTNNFLMLLAENRRLMLIEAIIGSFGIIMAGYRGEVMCEVVTATPIDDKMKQIIMENIKKAYKNDRQVTFKNIVDPEIIGGMIVKVDDYYVDMSIATKLRKYKEIMTKSI